MSDFMSHARNNAKFAQDQGQANPRAAQLNTRNASTFNPIGFNPEPTSFVDEDKLRKKEKQRQYRDQLDQMVSGVSQKGSSRKTTAELPQQQYQNQYENQFDPVREKRELEQRYMQANYDRQPEKSLPESRVLDPAPYNHGNDYGRYAAPQNDYNIISGNNHAKRGESPSQTQSRRQSQREPVGNEPASTFNQQDEMRDQLLAKIRSGNKQPNNYVYNTYQMAHEEREKSRRDFERNVVDKAAQEKLYKEDQRASSQWEQKKKLERDTYLANQQAIQAKSQQKKRNQQQELVADQGRIKDSLEQFEKHNYDTQARKQRLLEENSKVLQQQRYDYQSRKHDNDQDIRTSGAYGQSEPSPNKIPSSQYDYDRYPEQGQQQKAPLVNRPGAENWDHGDLASGMDNLNIKGGYGGQGGYPSYPQEDYAQKYYQEQPSYQQPPKDNYGYEAQPQSSQQAAPKYNPITGSPDARADYVKIRDKVRYGNNYNIISNELR